MRIWKKSGLGLKKNFKKKIKKKYWVGGQNLKSFVKQYSWRSAASP